MGLTRPRAHQLQDIDYKQTSRAITTTNITLSGSAPAVVDGVSLALNDRVLVTGQSTGSENGIYSVTTVGAGSNGTWARSSDADGAGEIKAGSIIMVTEGTVNADTQWKLTTDDPITIGQTALTFARNGNNAYGVFAVAGQSDIVADGVGDTLTVVAGTNIALTTNDSTDTLTITPSLTPALTTATFTNTTTNDTILLTTTEDSSTAGPVITLKRNSASPADADYLGQLKFQGENDADQEVVYAKITGKIQDGSDGSEDGIIEFANSKAGSNTITARLRSDSLQLLNGTTLVVAGLTYPTADGTNGQILQTDGSGTLSFADASGGGATVSSDTTTNAERLIYVGSTTTGTLSAVTQDSGLTYNPSTGSLTSATFITGSQGELRFADADSSNYVGFKSSTTVGSNLIWTLPAADGTNGQALVTNASGVLSWADASGGTGRTLFNYAITGTPTTVTGADSNGNTLAYTTGQLDVFLNGVRMAPADITATNGTSVVFGSALANSDVVDIIAYTTLDVVTNNADDLSSGTVPSARVAGSYTGITGTGALNAGTITSNFGAINNGASAITTTGVGTFGSLTASTSFTLLSQGELRLGDSDSSNYVGFKSPGTVASNLIFTLPSADGTSGQALVTDASGNLSFAAAGATITSDTTTNTDFLLYFASTTSGALTAVKQDSGLIYNPSTGTLTSAEFVGGGVGLTGLNGSNISSGTVAAARVATLNQNTTGTSGGLSSAVTVSLTGAVTGSATFTNAGDTASITTTATSDPTITLTGAVTGSGTMTNLGDVSFATTATSDPTITLGGDLSGSVTLTNLASGTLTATIAANSVALGADTTGNYVAAGAVSGTGLSGSAAGEGATFTVTSNATSANTGSTIVARDASGNFTAGVISATATAARYADLAEKYTSDEDYDPGTVVELGGTAEVTQTRRPTSLAIAGIVSTDPAYLMNSDSEGISVALIGRVPCKVTGKINKGDILVSSDIPGHAKAHREIHNPPAGSMIGKAIEAKDDVGLGTIEVLVGV